MNDKNVTPTDLDLLKYLTAQTVMGASYMRGWVDSTDLVLPGAREALLAMLANLRDQAAAVLAARGQDLDWYSTGFPVHTTTTWPDCTCEHFHLWHPYRLHADNLPREIAVLDCPGGGRHRMTVVGLGEIEITDLEDHPGAG